MSKFIMHRLIFMVITLVVISMLSFIIIQLPPGDYLTSYITQLRSMGTDVSDEQIDYLREQYGLDDPVYVQYFKWIGNFLTGDMGFSFAWNRPVNELVWERLGLTLVISISSLLFTWIVAFPIGIYTALKQNSLSDYFFTFISFIGVATPNFLLALVLMYVSFRYFGINVGGLFSPEYAEAAWSLAKVSDLLQHLWIPVVVVGTAGTAGLVRIMRANLLDELGKPYVTTAKSKGIPNHKVILKYPVRIALNPFISTLGWQLPKLISGSTITAVVLSLPTTGPLLLDALKSQDMYLAGSFIMLLSVLTVIGTFISDILLALVDPRIRYV
ncbi:peptide/nickel transport system permease protein [Halanaerobium saccharolyticum]|uniref:Peptide/nickel transport system permease protein n=1 Tax=Halanaerobium saccharolyticum TaxID=43595 RepID=A0A4R7YW32_9FIRM|nr:ABC transporter permease [Halanaerobium saccharolyticum]RAK07175.1 peptide/nickel transport system permease protein [Halanaerobium saccharolyticum]TDW02088.1 peptide/nickel transport system permease protein [Halanaerobium saccharolyticum]TDX58819.1 peptide/nickel transport system permease protein [Halanaerobium saccharolyticum]